jgi:hypothetical protein
LATPAKSHNLGGVVDRPDEKDDAMNNDPTVGLAPIFGPDDRNDPVSRKAKELYKSIREQQRFDEVTAALVEEALRREKLITDIELSKFQNPPLTETQEKQKFCFEEWQKGKTYKEINAALKQHSWDSYEHPKSVRGPIRAWSQHIGVEPRVGQRGRRKSSGTK